MVIAILGLGTIGSGVLEIAQRHPDITVKKVLEVRFKTELTTDNMEDITSDPEIELVVETMGGLHPAYEFASAAIAAGKHFVTANKLLVSAYGRELTALAREKNVAFLYDAACGGGIAYLENMKIAHGIDELVALGGIMNGTTNFILDSMQSEGMDYDVALKKAQELGYAERNPSADVDGLDTQRKLILSCAVAFDSFMKAEDIHTCGISSVKFADCEYAKKRGFALRLCASAEKQENGFSAYVEPAMVTGDMAESAIKKNVNYVWYQGKCYGLMGYIGQGAGKLPTGANVVRDVLSIMDGERYMTTDALRDAKPDNTAAKHSYYVRLPKGETLPEGWAARAESDGTYTYFETNDVSVADMHARFAGRGDAFFAGIRKA